MEFKGQIFMGNCCEDCTGTEIAHLYYLLSETLKEISGLQQLQDAMARPDGEDKRSIPEDIEEAKRMIEYNAGQIYLALTGKKIKRK